jgi:hypothetical protein
MEAIRWSGRLPVILFHEDAGGHASANSTMNTNTVSWTIAIFFGCSIAFAAIRKLTEDQGRGVTLLAQLAAGAVIVAVIVLVVRWKGRE